MDELFRNVRESATPAVWSKGVELSRQDAVTGDKETEDEIHLRIQGKDVAVSQAVTLFPLDGDWSCGCGGDDDPCAHVAAAVIALKRAREQGIALPKTKTGAGKLVYSFQRSPSGVTFEREIVSDLGRDILTVRLPAPVVAATAEDLEVDVALGSDRRGLLPARVFPKLLKALARGLDVQLDGQPVKIDPTPVGLVAEVTDEGPGVRVSAKVDPAIRESFANGVALCVSGLRPVVRPIFTPSETELLRDGRYFGPREWGDLAASVLPRLEEKLPVHVKTTRLPERQRAKPRLELHLDPKGENLEVSAAIVYGDPLLARVRLGHFEVLGDCVPIRDVDAERRLGDQLSRDLHLSLDESRTLPPSEAIRLVEQLGRFPGDVVGKGMARFQRFRELTPGVTFGESRFDVTFSSDGKTADPARVFQAFAAGEPLVPLLEGGFAPLPADWLRRHGDKVADLLAARSERGTLPRTAALLMADLADDLGQAVPSPLVGLREHLTQFQKLPAFRAPTGLKADLRHYQEDGVRWLSFLKSEGFGALLADDMGLGKTLQAIAILSGTSLVVCPTSVLENWRRELARFRPDLVVALYHGPSRVWNPAADVTLTTYAVLRLDTEVLSRIEYDVLVLDEAQMIKNPQSQAFKAAARLSGKFRVALSGTPVENRLEELWSLMHFLNPGLLGNLGSFKERFSRRIAASEKGAAERLRRLVRPFLLRRLKREVAPELPPRTEVVRHVELTTEERTRYDVVRAAARKDVVAKLGQGSGMLEALEALLRLRQACCHGALLPGGGAETSSKLELLTSLVAAATAEGHKTLVFSQWTSLLDLCEPALAGEGVTFTRLDGTTKDRAAVVDEFQAEGGPSVLLLSLKAGGVGLNLTAADHVVILDPWWNPAAEDQAADRAHRIGQTKPVLVQRLVVLDSVEEKILALQEKKRELAAVAFGEGAGASLTREDLLALLD